MQQNSFRILFQGAGLLLCGLLYGTTAAAQTHTWDSQHDTSKIEVSVVYFLPADREPLPDWYERAQYYCRRLELFHQREFQGRSELSMTLRETPLVSKLTTAELREGDANAIFFRTLREADETMGVTRFEGDAFPILLVLSEINWKPLDDFYRLRPADNHKLVFEGVFNGTQHFPGAESGGARATYLANPGAGWGLVSADGWRVPYCGSDCVVYHEGVGHTVGLPHPDDGNGSVMSQGQYQGWISESWLDRDQKERLGWTLNETYEPSAEIQLFSSFRALPQPAVPHPGEAVQLKLDWPAEFPVDLVVKRLQVRYQTAIDGPWIEVAQNWTGNAPQFAELGSFDRATPVSYRVDAETEEGSKVELWGYFQVRAQRDQAPEPFTRSIDLLDVSQVSGSQTSLAAKIDEPVDLEQEIDLLALIDLETAWQQGAWQLDEQGLISPKQYGARLELPMTPPAEYRLTLIVEPLDEPNGLIVGQRSGEQRFLTLMSYAQGDQFVSAIENIDGENIGNATTYTGDLFRKGRLSQVVTTVTEQGVEVLVDGRKIVDWSGDAKRLSLSDYWETPDAQRLFIGAYDCRYRIVRFTMEPLKSKTE